MASDYNAVETQNPFIGADDPEEMTLESDGLESNEHTESGEPEQQEASPPEPSPELEAKDDEASETESSAQEDVSVSETEEEAKAAPEPEPEPKKLKIQVPKSRLDAEIAKRRELEAKLQEMQQEVKPQAGEININGVDPKSMFDKVLDGDVDAASQMFLDTIKSVAQTTAQSVTENLTPQIQAAPNITQAQMALNQAADEISAKYDVLNPQAEAFSETVQNEVIDLRDMYIDRGYAAVDALHKATNMVMASEGITPKSDAPAPAPVKKAPPNLEQKIKAAQSQPPVPQVNQGSPEESFDIMNMTDTDLDQLSEAQLARLRGDFL